MKTRAKVTLGLSALVMGGTMVGCTANQGGVASASARSESSAAKQAAIDADTAIKAFHGNAIDRAVSYAESAVSLQPRDAGYRALLGQVYLHDGRFTSAREAFADTLKLDPANGKVALNLALAQTAEGDWASARSTLDANTAIIPVADRGLAMALAGNPDGAVLVLTDAARDPSATAKTRQNLALALAMAGRWPEARAVASVDVGPAQIDKRITEWAAFTHPESASDQVAKLLGVTARQDPGLPVALALNSASPAAVAEQTYPVESHMPGQAAASEIAASDVQAGGVRFAPRQEVVQAIPVSHAVIQTRQQPVAIAATANSAPAPVSRSYAKGNYYVQLGAYDSAAVAKDGWARAKQRFAAFADQTPSGMAFASHGDSYYRLSVGGFSKADARAMCGQYKAQGGHCFIRTDSGDQVAQWVAKGREVASR